MNQPSSFWSRTFSILNKRVTLRLYFGEVRISEFQQLLAEAKAEFNNLAVPQENLILSCNRAGMHLMNFVRMEEPAIEAVRQKLESEKWKMAND